MPAQGIHGPALCQDIQEPATARRSYRSMIHSFGISHVGRVRKNNEDRLLEDPALGLYLVADGMGGALAGERAAQLAAETIEAEIRAIGPHAGPDDLERAVHAANRIVREEAQANSQYAGMGTTVVAVLLRQGKAYGANVGDSRLYRMRGNTLECITSDHSWINEVGRNIGLSDAELKTHAYRNMLTRAIGADDTVEGELLEVGFVPGDILLLSSDGLHGVIEDSQIAAILASSSSLPELGQALVDLVLESGAPDNVTAVLISAD
jgi:protein phosphatase